MGRGCMESSNRKRKLVDSLTGSDASNVETQITATGGVKLVGGDQGGCRRPLGGLMRTTRLENHGVRSGKLRPIFLKFLSQAAGEQRMHSRQKQLTAPPAAEPGGKRQRNRLRRVRQTSSIIPTGQDSSPRPTMNGFSPDRSESREATDRVKWMAEGVCRWLAGGSHAGPCGGDFDDSGDRNQSTACSIHPPPRTRSPAKTTAAWPGATPACGSSNRTANSSGPVAVTWAGCGGEL